MITSIYKIVNTKDDMVFIGLTSSLIPAVLATVKNQALWQISRKNPLIMHMRKHGIDCFTIELIRELAVDENAISEKEAEIASFPSARLLNKMKLFKGQDETKQSFDARYYKDLKRDEERFTKYTDRRKGYKLFAKETARLYTIEI